MDAVIKTIRGSLGTTIKAPTTSSRVSVDCCYSLDTPFTPGNGASLPTPTGTLSCGGTYLNLQTYTASSPRFLALDRARTGCNVYLHIRHTRVPTDAPLVDSSSAASSTSSTPAPAPAAPTKLALGMPGGFSLDTLPNYTVEKSHTLVVFAGGPAPTLEAGVALAGGHVSDLATLTALAASTPLHAFPDYPSPPPTATTTASASTSAPSYPALPEFLSTVVAGVLAHEHKSSTTAAAVATAWEEEVHPSAYSPHLVGQVDPATGSPRVISPHPSAWVCDAPGCGIREGLWLNLTDGYMGCGREQFGGAPGKGHAKAHYEAGGRTFPLCVKLGTINAAGGECYDYSEDAPVEDPLLAKHLAFFGIQVMAWEKTEKSTSELALEFTLNHDWNRLCESGSDLVPVSGPGRIGLENLGNTCYMNATLQLLAAVEAWSAPYVALNPAIVAGAPKEQEGGGGGGGIRDDLLSQVSSLFTALHSNRYASVPPPPVEAVGAAAGDATTAAATAATAPLPSIEPAPGTPCGYVVPRHLRRLLGKGHPEFSSSRQQDAPEFLEWVFTLFTRAAATAGSVGGGERAGRLARNGSPFLINPQALLQYRTQKRLHCMQSGLLKYKQNDPDTFLRLNIPEDRAINLEEIARLTALREATKASFLSSSGGSGSRSGSGSGSSGSVGDGSKRARMGEGEGGALGGVKLDGDGLPIIPKPIIPFSECLATFSTQETLTDYLSPATGVKGVAHIHTTLTHLPPYLLIVLNRYKQMPDWTTKKIDSEVPFPLHLDLSPLLPPSGTRGLQPGEAELPQQQQQEASPPPPSTTATASATSAGAPTAAFDPTLLATLTSMGFVEGTCKRAMRAMGPTGDAEGCMEWIMGHMDDADFAADYVEEGGAGAGAAGAAAGAGAGSGGGGGGGGGMNDGAVASLCDMGFSEAKAKKALQACGFSVERAMDWLFSHGEEEGDEGGGGGMEVEEGGGAAGAGAGAGGASSSLDDFTLPPTPANARYEMVGIVSHMGSSPASGHYVAHIRKDEGGRPVGAVVGGGGSGGAAGGEPTWLIFNDAKVAMSKDPPLEAGFMYLYKRLG